MLSDLEVIINRLNIINDSVRVGNTILSQIHDVLVDFAADNQSQLTDVNFYLHDIKDVSEAINGKLDDLSVGIKNQPISVSWSSQSVSISGQPIEVVGI